MVEKAPPSYDKTMQGDTPSEIRFALLRELSTFCDYTSAHGFPHIKRAKAKLGKAIWALLCITFIVILIFEIYSIIDKYLKKPHNVLVEMKFDRTLAFPAVTICNLNPYR